MKMINRKSKNNKNNDFTHESSPLFAPIFKLSNNLSLLIIIRYERS